MAKAVYPGSFDPITNGHLDLISRAAEIFEEVIVAVSINSKKTPLFTMEERVEMIREILKPYPNVRVDSFQGLTVDYLKAQDANVIVRGLRAVSDFENELQMAVTNKKLQPTIETMFMMAKPDFSFISSSLIKEIAAFNGCIKGFVPELVEINMKKKFCEKNS